MYVCRNVTFFVLRLTNADFVPHDCMNFLSFNCIRIYNTPYTRYVYSCYSSIQYLNLHSFFLRMKGFEIFFCLSYRSEFTLYKSGYILHHVFCIAL